MSIHEDIQGELRRGRTPEEIVEGLVRQGLSAATARRFVDRAAAGGAAGTDAAAAVAAPSGIAHPAPGGSGPALTAAVVTEKFTFGSVLGTSLGVWAANFLPFLVLTAICYLPLVLYTIGFVNKGRFTLDTLQEFNLVQLGCVLFLGTIASGAVTYGVVQQIRGEHAGIGQCISVGVSRLLPVIGSGLLVGLCVLGALIPLVALVAVVARGVRDISMMYVAMIVGSIPAVLVTCRLWVTVTVAVVERPGVMASLRRSAELTRGRRLGIFGLLFVLGFVNWGVNKAIEAAIIRPPLTLSDIQTYFYANLGALLVLSALSSTTQAVSYYRLRLEKEGVDVEGIAQVFG